MEVAGCILLLLQLFVHLLSTTLIYSIFFPQTNPSHVSFHLFPPFHPWSTLFMFSTHFMYHCLHQNIFLNSSQIMTITPHTIFALTSLSVASFNPNMSISSSVFLLSTNFIPYITLTIDLSALLRIPTSFSLKHHVLPPYNITDLT